jgi:protocatechuate 3,4-dioxygenase beta subunit
MRSWCVLVLALVVTTASGCRERMPAGSGGPAAEGGWLIEGRVTLAGGAPASPMSVRAVRIEEGGRRASYGATDHEGRFTLAAIEQGAWRLSVASLGDVVLETNLVVSGPRQRIDLVLPSGAVAGVLLDAERRPVAGVSVLLTGRDLIRRQTSDEGGAFRFVAVSEGSYTVSPELGSAGTWRRRIVTVTDALVSLPEFVPGAWRMCGRIIDHEGDAITGAVVVARPLDGELRASGVRGRAVSDADGRFCASNLYAGAYEVAVDAGERGRLRLDRMALEAHRDDLSLVLGGGGELLGHVAYPGGAPATGVMVQAVLPAEGEVFSSRCLTDASGRFRLPRLRPGAYRLFARGDEGLSPWASVEVLPSARPADYELKLTGAGATLEGVVMREGRPAEKATVLLEHRWGLDLPVMKTTDAEGRYAFTGLPGGFYVLRAVADGEWHEREVRVGDEEVVTADLTVGE